MSDASRGGDREGFAEDGRWEDRAPACVSCSKVSSFRLMTSPCAATPARAVRANRASARACRERAIVISGFPSPAGRAWR